MAAVRTADLPFLHYRVHNNVGTTSHSFSRCLSGDAKLIVVERGIQLQGRLLSSLALTIIQMVMCRLMTLLPHQWFPSFLIDGVVFIRRTTHRRGKVVQV